MWILVKHGDIVFSNGPFYVTSVKQFLPAGPTKRGERLISLVDFFTDGGERVAAVADIWGRDPNTNSKPW